MSVGMSTAKRISPVRRTRLYFVIIAILMTITLFFLSYSWNMPGKIYRISMTNTQGLQLLAGSNGSTTIISELHTSVIRESYVKNVTHSNNESHPNTIPRTYNTSGAPVDNVIIRYNQPDTKPSDENTNVSLDNQERQPSVVNNNIDQNDIKHIDNSYKKKQTTLAGTIKSLDNQGNYDNTSGIFDKIVLNTSMSKSSSSNHFIGYNQGQFTLTKDNGTIASINKTNMLHNSLPNDITKAEETLNPSAIKYTEITKYGKVSDSIISSKDTLSYPSIATKPTDTKPPPKKLDHDMFKQKYSSKSIYDREKLKKDAYQRYKAYRYKNRLLDRFKHGSLHSMDGFPHGDLGKDGAVPTPRPEGCNSCFKTDFKSIINASDICKNGTEIDLLIMIASAPKNSAARNVIRETWGKVCNDDSVRIKCVYVFGKHKQDDVNTALVKESQLRHDIIQFEFQDTYANLTFKTMMSLQWASENCPQTKYIMKTDDDMYVNTELLPLLLKGAPQKRFFGGFCWGRSAPHRDMNSKWYVSFKQYSQPFYPQMCSGTGYVFSGDVALGVLEKSKDIPFFYLEDVYVSLCLNKLGVHPVFLTGFSNTKIKYDPCSYRNSVITSHGLGPEELESIWTNIKKCNLEKHSPEMLYIPRFVR